jgi:NAD-reducing hydrogenase large subunit
MTSEAAETLRRVVIDPVTRVEGHGKVTLLLDGDGRVQQARLHIVEFRGFEKFIQGRPYWEIPVLVQRLCGICPVSHHLVAAKAIDQLVGVRSLPPAAEKLRRLLHLGQVLQSHALHFFHLASPDLLFGFDSPAAQRNLFGVIAAHPDLALDGVRLRKYGQELIRILAGKRIHGTLAVPGGVNRSLAIADRDALLGGIEPVLVRARAAVALARRLLFSNPDWHRSFACFESNFLSLVGPGGALDLYDGRLRARDGAGGELFDRVDVRRYGEFLHEQVKSWTYLKFPFIVSLGPERGWYRVGPLARLNLADSIPTPLAERERQRFRASGRGRPVSASLAYHWARMIELLHAAEAIRDLLLDPDLLGGELRATGEPALEGIGVLEAPRGTLLHHYQVNEQGQITRANLIVSTTHNNEAMNRAVRAVADRDLTGRELTEGLLNHIEVAIRAYDPCLSCATHALGRMPLVVELIDDHGQLLERRLRAGQEQP